MQRASRVLGIGLACALFGAQREAHADEEISAEQVQLEAKAPKVPEEAPLEAPPPPPHKKGFVLDGAIGVLLVLNATQGDVGAICEHWLSALYAIDPQLSVVIGITHSERLPGFSMGTVRSAIRRCGRVIPAFTFDARERAQAMHLVRALLLSAQLAR